MISEFKSSVVYRVLGQQGLHRETHLKKLRERGKKISGPREMAQHLGAHVVLPEDLGSGFYLKSTHDDSQSSGTQVPGIQWYLLTSEHTKHS